MKKIFITAFICFGLSGWLAVIYQHNLQKRAEAKIKDSVIRELESKKEIEDSIRRERESSEKANEFISRREYEEGVEESLKHALEGYRKENADYRKDMDASFKELLKSSEDRISGQSRLLEIYKNRLEEFEKGKADLARQIEELKPGLAGALNKIENLEENQAGYARQLRECNRRLEELKARQEAFKEQAVSKNSLTKKSPVIQ